MYRKSIKDWNDSIVLYGLSYRIARIIDSCVPSDQWLQAEPL